MCRHFHFTLFSSLDFLQLQVYIAVFSIMNGDGKKLVYGYDSFGNTCNQNNVNNKITNVTDSGRDLQGFRLI